MNGEISKIFHHVKTYKEQPGRHLFCLPSGLATFTRFALRSQAVCDLKKLFPLEVEGIWDPDSCCRPCFAPLLPAGHWVRKYFAQCRRLIMK